MKKLIAGAAALMMTAACFNAFAEAAALEPTHELNMETYGTETCTVPASFTSGDVDENNVLAYSVYDVDLYDAAQVQALKEGDTVLVNDEQMTVAAVANNDGAVEINGGFFNEDGEEGATFQFVDGDPDHMFSQQYDDLKAMTMMGQAAFQFADQVTVRSFRMTADGEFNGEYDEVTMPAAEVKAYLAKLEDNMIEFSQSGTKVTLENGKITRIDVEWTPNA